LLVRRVEPVTWSAIDLNGAVATAH
jgi:hypothetical protein